MPKKHRPKRGVIRKTGREIYFAYAVLVALCLIFGLYLIIGASSDVHTDESVPGATSESNLQVEPSNGNTPGSQQEVLNESLQSSESGQEALQGSVNSQSPGVGSDQLQPSTGKEEYETYENQ